MTFEFLLLTGWDAEVMGWEVVDPDELRILGTFASSPPNFKALMVRYKGK